MTEPLSLLVFTVDSLRLGLRLEAVDQAVRACEVTPLPGAPAPVVGAINMHGEIIPVLDLRQRLGLPARAIGVDDQFLMVRADDRRYAVPVDEVDGVCEFALEDVVPAGKLVDGLPHLEGAVRLPDGLLLIEDPRRFLDIDGLQELARALQQERERGP